MDQTPRQVVLKAKSGTPNSAGSSLDQLMMLMEKGIRSEMDDRLRALEDTIQALNATVAAGASKNGSAPSGESVRDVVTGVLVDSGLLEQCISTAVERKVGESGGGGELTRQAASVAKEFLAENLGTLFKKEIETAVQDAIHKAFSSEEVKILIDEKFRAVTLYLKTEVIPKAVRQAMGS